MLAEAPNRGVELWWNWYCRFALWRHFHRVMLYGSPLVEGGKRPTLYLANHSSFWDGIVLSHVLRSVRGERGLRCMIDEAQVRRHPFFRKVGGFSVNRDSPKDALRSCLHAAELLRGGHSVVLFPQGGMRSGEEWPIRLERGFTYILDKAPAAEVVICCLRYEFWEHQRPELMLWSSRVLSGSSVGLDDTAACFAEGDAALREASVGRKLGRVVLERRGSIESFRWG